MAAGLAQAAPDLTVTDVKYWSLGDTTRVSVEVSGEFRHKSSRIDNPARLFFDIAGAKPAMAEKGESKVVVNDGLLKQIRIAETKPGVTRVVLDLEEGVEYKSSQLSGPERLMIELTSKNGRAKSTETKPVDPKPVEPKPAEIKPSEIKPKFAPLEDKIPTLPPPAVTKSELPMIPAQEALTTIAKPTTTAKAVSTKSTAAPVGPPAAPPSSTAAPQSAARNSNGDRSLTRVLGLKMGKIVIDAGHGGHDPGTHGKSGLLEKDLVLDIAKRLAKMLEEKSSAEVLLTRSDDTFIALEDRSAVANIAKADLFLSIHANSNPSKSIAGIETYYLNFSASREDLDLAARENATAKSTIGELREVLSKIALRAKLDESREFAVQLHNSLHDAAKSQNKEAKERPVKKAPFVVLIEAEMPAVLAEIGYLSNSKEEELLKTDAYRDKVAEALFEGIEKYMKTLGQGARASLE